MKKYTDKIFKSKAHFTVPVNHNSDEPSQKAC